MLCLCAAAAPNATDFDGGDGDLCSWMLLLILLLHFLRGGNKPASRMQVIKVRLLNIATALGRKVVVAGRWALRMQVWFLVVRRTRCGGGRYACRTRQWRCLLGCMLRLWGWALILCWLLTIAHSIHDIHLIFLLSALVRLILIFLFAAIIVANLRTVCVLIRVHLGQRR